MHDTWNIARMKKTFKYKLWKKKEMKNLIEFLYLKTLKCDIFLDITCIKMYVTEFTFKIFTFCSIRWINYITIISRFAKFDVYCKPIVKTWSWALIESLQYQRKVLDKKRCCKLMLNCLMSKSKFSVALFIFVMLHDIWTRFIAFRTDSTTGTKPV